jgi:hypothetical protein
MATIDTTRQAALTPYGTLWRPGRSWYVPAIGWGLLFLVGIGTSHAPLTGIVDRLTVAGVGFAFALIASVVLTLTHLGDDYSAPLRVYQPATVFTGVLWLTATTATSALPLTSEGWGYGGYAALAIWAVLAFAGTATWHRVKTSQLSLEQDLRERRRLIPVQPPAPVQPPPPPPPVRTPEEKERDEWNDIFRRASLDGLLFQRRQVTIDSNFVLDVEFAEGSRMNFTALDNGLEALEMVLDRVFADSGGVRSGAIRIERGVNFKGQPVPTRAKIYVDLEDILARITYMPAEHGAMSIYNAFRLGVLENGLPLMTTPADIHRMLVGQTREGKSNGIGVFIWQLSRCTDALIWGIDFKGGRLFRAWVELYLRNVIDPRTDRPLARPIIDWVGTNRFVAERIFLSAIAAAKARPRLASGTKWMATPKHPAIFVISDEIAEGTGQYAEPGFGDLSQGASSSELAAFITRGHMLGAGEGVYFITASQRATVTMMPGGDAKSQMGGRYGWRMADTGDSSDIFQGSDRTAGARMHAQLLHKGSVVVQDQDNPQPVRAKFDFLGDGDDHVRRVHGAVFEHTQWRPDLDEGTAAAIERYGYSHRWDRDQLGWFWGEEHPERRWNAPAARPEAGVPANAAQLLGVDDEQESPFQTSPVATLTDDPDDESTEMDAVEEAAFQRVKAAYDGPAYNAIDPYTRFLGIVKEAGWEGITPTAALTKMAAEGCAPEARTTIYSFRDRGVLAGAIAQPIRNRKGLMFDIQFSQR